MVGSSLNYCNEKHGFINCIFILAFAVTKTICDYRSKYVEANQVTQYTKSWEGLHVEGGVVTKSKFTLNGGYYGLWGGTSFTATGIKKNENIYIELVNFEK